MKLYLLDTWSISGIFTGTMILFKSIFPKLFNMPIWKFLHVLLLNIIQIVTILIVVHVWRVIIKQERVNISCVDTILITRLETQYIHSQRPCLASLKSLSILTSAIKVPYQTEDLLIINEHEISTERKKISQFPQTLYKETPSKNPRSSIERNVLHTFQSKREQTMVKRSRGAFVGKELALFKRDKLLTHRS